MVKKLTDKQILDRVKALPSFKGIPKNYWLVGVRSDEDAANVMDDKFYLFNGESFVMVVPGTTNKGLKGTAVMKDDEIYYDSFIRGLHKGKMPCFRQHKPVLFYRDFNNDGKADQVGKIYCENIAMNIHGISYEKNSTKKSTTIGGWSEGCQVFADMEKYNQFLSITQPQNLLTYALLREKNI